MISVTGYEHDGIQVSASSVQTYAFFFFIFVMCLHVFTRNTPYRSKNPLRNNYDQRTIKDGPVNSTVPTGDIVEDVVNATIDAAVNATADILES